MLIFALMLIWISKWNITFVKSVESPVNFSSRDDNGCRHLLYSAIYIEDMRSTYQLKLALIVNQNIMFLLKWRMSCLHHRYVRTYTPCWDMCVDLSTTLCNHHRYVWTYTPCWKMCADLSTICAITIDMYEHTRLAGRCVHIFLLSSAITIDMYGPTRLVGRCVNRSTIFCHHHRYVWA